MGRSRLWQSVSQRLARLLRSYADRLSNQSAAGEPEKEAHGTRPLSLAEPQMAPPEEWLKIAYPGPPAHWVEKVRHAAPQLLRPGDRFPGRQSPAERQVQFDRPLSSKEKPEPAPTPLTGGRNTLQPAPQFQPESVSSPVRQHGVFRPGPERKIETKPGIFTKTDAKVRQAPPRYRLHEPDKPPSAKDTDRPPSPNVREPHRTAARLPSPQPPVRRVSVQPQTSAARRDPVWAVQGPRRDAAESPSYRRPNECSGHDGADREWPSAIPRDDSVPSAAVRTGSDRAAFAAAEENGYWPELILEKPRGEPDRLAVIRTSRELARRRAAEAEQTGS
jgi:hypothetical protein